MARILNKFTLQILAEIKKHPAISPQELHKQHQKNTPYKELYNTVFRLTQLDLIAKQKLSGVLSLTLTPEGEKTLLRKNPERDGVWKIIIFDIPEKQKYVRTVMRAKLKSLNFKKWQNSIWISPYALDKEVEAELDQLANKYFIRLIKTTSINRTDDLEKLF